MVYTVSTTTDIETVKQEIEAKAKQANFGVLNSYDFKQILQGKGFPIEKEITVFELCNPAGAQQALEYLSEISVYLPCRISVYEDQGKTILATIGLEDIVNSVGTDERFKAYMIILFDNLKQVMHSWDERI